MVTGRTEPKRDLTEPNTETVNAISKGLGILSKRSGCPASSLMAIALASDMARAAGVEPDGKIRTEEQAAAVLGFLRYCYRDIEERRKRRESAR